ncbi:amine oxidase [Dermatophagoides farinae]|uniref:Amine oxidase n=1 Tax=Dermatophagoides farinae TaxID=6954 RepID=A0A9D4SFE8_DERFA|nr:amine oxidase [Dermatophagoides farinae]
MPVVNECTNDSDRYNVAIIGAGLSGLYAANILNDYGITNYCVLEARDRIGGRLLTKKDPKVGWVDLGGSYVGPSQHYIQKLIQKLGIETYKIDVTGKSVYLNQKRRYLHNGNELPSLSNKLVELEIRHVLKLMDEMSEQLPRDEPWKHPQAIEWDRQTFGQFLDKHCWSQEAKDFIAIYIGCCTSCEAYEQSLLWSLWYIRQCDGLDIMYNIENSAQDSKLVGGTQQICQQLLQRIGVDKVKLSKPVTQIIMENKQQQQSESKSLIRIKTLDGECLKCNYIIMAIPPVLVQKIHFNPSLPPVYSQMLQKFTMGSAIKCIVYYKEQFWRNDQQQQQQPSLNGNMLINCPQPCDGPITYTVDDTKPDGSYPAIVGFIIGDRARDMLERSREERLHYICQSYSRAFDSKKALQPIHYEEQNWMAEQYTGGCFTGLGAPGFLTNYGLLLKQPLFDCIFPAGTETSTHWAGFMDGALQSGERAAFEVLSRLNCNIKIELIQVYPIETIDTCEKIYSK